jgi:hypothetical protein
VLVSDVIKVKGSEKDQQRDGWGSGWQGLEGGPVLGGDVIKVSGMGGVVDGKGKGFKAGLCW